MGAAGRNVVATRKSCHTKLVPSRGGGPLTNSVEIWCAPRIAADRDWPGIPQPAKKFRLLALTKRVLKPQDKNLLGKKVRMLGKKTVLALN